MAEGQIVVISQWYWVLSLKIAFISKPEKNGFSLFFFTATWNPGLENWKRIGNTTQREL